VCDIEEGSEAVEDVQTGRQSFESTWRPRHAGPCLPEADDDGDTGPNAQTYNVQSDHGRPKRDGMEKSRRVTRRPGRGAAAGA